jgi:hypothetical protein
MKDPHDIAMESEENLPDFVQWQIDYEPTNDFQRYAEVTISLPELIKSSVLLYPRFQEIEGVIVLKNQYSEQNWKAWRIKNDAKTTADMLNHIHVAHLYTHDSLHSKLEGQLGALLAFYWQLAVQHQFPEHNVTVDFDGEILHVINN